jgi:flavodoxin
MITYRIFSVKEKYDNICAMGGYKMTDKLVVFYSRADENYVSGAIKNLKVGNTEVAAEMIASLTGADLFKVEQINPYSKDYNECIAEAQADQRRNARPELKRYPESLDGYDVIYLGYPNYWGTMPMALFTFLEHFDLSGKTIKPFCTHEGSGMGTSIDDVKKLCPDSDVEKGLAIRGGSVSRAKNEIEKWI